MAIKCMCIIFSLRRLLLSQQCANFNRLKTTVHVNCISADGTRFHKKYAGDQTVTRARDSKNLVKVVRKGNFMQKQSGLLRH